MWKRLVNRLCQSIWRRTCILNGMLLPWLCGARNANACNGIGSYRLRRHILVMIFCRPDKTILFGWIVNCVCSFCLDLRFFFFFVHLFFLLLAFWSMTEAIGQRIANKYWQRFFFLFYAKSFMESGILRKLVYAVFLRKTHFLGYRTFLFIECYYM